MYFAGQQARQGAFTAGISAQHNPRLTGRHMPIDSVENGLVLNRDADIDELHGLGVPKVEFADILAKLVDNYKIRSTSVRLLRRILSYLPIEGDPI